MGVGFETPPLGGGQGTGGNVGVPPAPPGQGAGAGAGRELADFLSELHDFLADTRSRHPDWVIAELRQVVAEAWDEVQPSFATADTHLRQPRDPDLLETQLADAGFRPRGRRLKLRGFAWAKETFLRRPTKKALGKVLGWANIIVGSLCGIVPGIEAIKEFKESYEQATSDDGEDQPSQAGTGTPP
jgi:hypothetical protein